MGEDVERTPLIAKDAPMKSHSAAVQTQQSKKDLSHATNKLLTATGLCLVFMTIEIVGGYIAGSLAIMTDAAHLFSDVAGFLISIFALQLSDLAATKNFSYGYGRAEVLGALFSVVLIWVLTGGLLIESVRRTHAILTNTQEEYVDGKIMTIIAIIGVFSNLVILKVLGHNHSHDGGHGHSHDHAHGAKSHSKRTKIHASQNGYHNDLESGTKDHGHSHSDHGHSHNNHGHSHSGHGHNDSDHHDSHSHDDHHDDSDHHGHSHAEKHPHSHGHGHDSKGTTYGTTESSDDEEELEHNINVAAAYAHAIGDLMQSISVCIAGGLIWYMPGTEYPYVQLADPIATFVFSLLVVWTTSSVLRTSVNVLMQGVPAGIDAHKISRELKNVDGVVGVHHLHIWSITIGEPSLSVHVQVAEAEHMNKVLKRVQHLLREKNFHHSTVQIELYDDKYCHPDNCSDSDSCDDYALSCHDGGCHPYKEKGHDVH